MVALTFAIGLLVLVALIITIYAMIKKTVAFWLPLLIVEVALFLLTLGGR